MDPEQKIQEVERKITTLDSSFRILEERMNTHSHTSSDLTRALVTNRYLVLRLHASATAAATGNGIGGDYVMPISGSITEVGVTVDTAGTTGTLTVDINKNATTILSTKITVDSGEKTSRTAAALPVISSTTFTTGDIFTFDIDAIHTTPSSGLTVFMNIKQV